MNRTTSRIKSFTRTRVAFGLALAVAVLLWATRTPLKDRDWSEDQMILPEISISDSVVDIRNIRDISYRSDTDYDVKYYSRQYNISKLERVWYVVELFSDWRGPAHTMLSFEFEDSVFLTISVEIRKEKGESFSPLWGMLRQYEIMYVIADEEDALKLRTNHRPSTVYLYPVKADALSVQSLLIDMLGRADKLKRVPEFYNSLVNTCTTNILLHLNRVSHQNIPINLKVLLPGYSDVLAFELDLIDTELSLEEARKHFRIDGKAQALSGTGSFSTEIRQGLLETEERVSP